MRIIMSSIIVLLLFIVIGCQDSDDSKDFEIEMLSNTWVHSFEEESGETYDYNIYRPEDYKEFAATWFRQKYIFKNDNSCQWLVLAANDGHFLVNGSWFQHEENDSIIVIFDSTGTMDEDMSFKIKLLNANKLEIEDFVF